MDGNITLDVILTYKGQFYRRFPINIIRTTNDPALPKREVQYQAMKRGRELVMDIEYDNKLGRFAPWRNALT